MGTPKLAGHTVQGTLGSPVWYTGLLLHCWVMRCGYYQYFARSDVYAIFYHWQFARGFQLVPNQSPKTGVLETHRGRAELSRLPSELRLEAELAVHTAS